MERSFAALILILTLAGCSSGSGRMFEQAGPVAITPPMNQEPLKDAGPANQEPHASQEPQRDLSPAARSAATKGVYEQTGGALMECVSDSCRINCSPRLEKRVRPKWCARFKEPLAR